MIRAALVSIGLTARTARALARSLVLDAPRQVPAPEIESSDSRSADFRFPTVGPSLGAGRGGLRGRDLVALETADTRVFGTEP